MKWCFFTYIIYSLSVQVVDTFGVFAVASTPLILLDPTPPELIHQYWCPFSHHHYYYKLLLSLYTTSDLCFLLLAPVLSSTSTSRASTFFRSFLYRCEWHKVFYWWATYKQLALLSTFSFFNEVKVTYIPIIEGVGMIFEILFIWPTLWPICHTARDLLVANTSGENSHHREDIDFLKQIMPQKLKLIGGFSIEIKAKIRYLIICCYHNNVLCIYDNHISRDIMFRF